MSAAKPTPRAAAPKSRLVVLALPPQTLARFPHQPPSKPSDASKRSSSSPNPPAHGLEPAPADDAATPVNAAASLLAPPASKRKAPPGPRAGTKRSAAAVDGTSKARAKPGPKKKQRIGDMINDPNHKGPFAASAALPKLGPKANMGAINAGLRALDRTGKPCRRWEKKGFQIRSFTGVVWDVAAWRAPKKSAVFADDVKSDTTGSSDTKVKDESSAISDKSGAIGDAGAPIPPPLRGVPSPAPVAAAS